MIEVKANYPAPVQPPPTYDICGLSEEAAAVIYDLVFRRICGKKARFAGELALQLEAQGVNPNVRSTTRGFDGSISYD